MHHLQSPSDLNYPVHNALTTCNVYHIDSGNYTFKSTLNTITKERFPELFCSLLLRMKLRHRRNFTVIYFKTNSSKETSSLRRPFTIAFVP